MRGVYNGYRMSWVQPDPPLVPLNEGEAKRLYQITNTDY